MSDSDERSKIAARIRALLAKTVENGCTEDEAVAAAQKAAEMLARYNLTVDEVKLRESPFSRHRERHDDEVGDRLWKIADALAELTGVRYWAARAGEPAEINFFGFAHEVDVAKYLLEICARAMRAEYRRIGTDLRLLTPVRRRWKLSAFLDGMSDTLASRLKALKEPAKMGTGLVVLRDSLIDAAIPFKLESRQTRRSRDFERTYRDGMQAGERVPLNPGITGSQQSRGRLGHG